MFSRLNYDLTNETLKCGECAGVLLGRSDKRFKRVEDWPKRCPHCGYQLARPLRDEPDFDFNQDI